MDTLVFGEIRRACLSPSSAPMASTSNTSPGPRRCPLAVATLPPRQITKPHAMAPSIWNPSEYTTVSLDVSVSSHALNSCAAILSTPPVEIGAIGACDDRASDSYRVG